MRGSLDLKTWCERHQKLRLISQWNYTKNTIAPTEISYGSIKKVWWKCDKCGYEWQTTPNHRTTSTNENCPLCNNKVLVTGVNDLATLYPNIAKLWHPSLNDIKPTEVQPFSNLKAWWKCEKDPRHYFQSAIYSVVSGQTVCPICSNQQVLTGINDLATTNPDLLKEWNYEKNQNIDPQKLTHGTNKKVWWKCEKCGYEWNATISSRAGNMHCGCPNCSKQLHISKQEKTIAYYLSQHFEICENKRFNWLNPMELDIYIPELHLGIEYDGEYWHTDSTRDLKKDLLCQQHGITLLRIREKNCPTYTTCAKIIIIENCNNSSRFLSNTINEVFTFINEQYHLSLHFNGNLENDYLVVLKNIRLLEHKNSVASIPKLLNEWDYEKNGDLKPETIALGSKEKVWWKCGKGHEWQAAVYSRKQCGCPYCSNQKVLAGYNDLATSNPEIAKEWNYEKNDGLTPTMFAPQSNKVVWWTCSKCGYVYKTAISHRTNGRNCMLCGRIMTSQAHEKSVRNIETGIIYKSIKEAAIQTNISAGAIGNCCRKKTKTSGGYHWEFVKK